MTTPTSIVRVNQPQTIQQQQIIQNQGQFVPQTLWTNNTPQSPQQQFTLQKQTQPSAVLQYATVKNGKRKFFFLFVTGVAFHIFLFSFLSLPWVCDHSFSLISSITYRYLSFVVSPLLCSTLDLCDIYIYIYMCVFSYL